MHLTKIILKKNGKKFKGPIDKIGFDSDVFEYSYIKLFTYPTLFYICDIASAITERERVSISRIEDIDEIERMRKIWMHYKKGDLKLIESDFVKEKYRLKKK